MEKREKLRSQSRGLNTCQDGGTGESGRLRERRRSVLDVHMEMCGGSWVGVIWTVWKGLEEIHKCRNHDSLDVINATRLDKVSKEMSC